MTDTGFHVGDEIILTGTFTDPDTGNPVDPSTARAGVLLPDGTTVDLNTAQASTGVYTASWVPTVPGDHYYAFSGDGAATRYEQEVINIKPRRVAIA